MTDRSRPAAVLLACCLLAVGLALAVGATAGVGDDVTAVVGEEPTLEQSASPDGEGGALGAAGPLEPAVEEVSTAEGVSLACAVGDDDGPVWVTDTGLAIVDDSAVDAPYPEFTAAETVAFANASFSADGPADAIYDGGTASVTCLSDVNASTAPLRIAPAAADANATTIDGEVEAFVLGSLAYDREETDLAYAADDPIALSIEGSGLANQTAVTATADDGSTLDETTVDADGTIALSLPDGEYEVTLTTEPESPLAPYTDDDGVVRTDGLRDAIDDWRSGEIGTDLLRDVIDAWRSGDVVT